MAEENNKTAEEAVKKEEDKKAEEKKEEKVEEEKKEEEKKDEVKKEESEKEEERREEEKKEIEVPDKFKNIVEEIEKMTVLELSELVKVLEEKFGVSAQAMMAPVVGAGSAAGGADKEEGGLKTVELKAAGDQKIQVIKVIKEVLDLGLKDAKDFVDNAPKVVKEGLKPEEAEELKKKLEEAGATVEIK